MSLPTKADVMTMNYASEAEPFMGVEAKALSPSTLSLDYAFLAEPFIAPNAAARRIILFT